MNKYQEALDDIKYTVVDEVADGYHEPKTVEDFNYSQCELMQELVNKETPKKPIDQGYKLSWIEKLLGVQKPYRCPHCYNSCLVKYAPNGRNINSHCYECGGAVDWSEEEC